MNENLKLISLFLNYPSLELKENINLLNSLVANRFIQHENTIHSLNNFINQFKAKDLIELQEEYVRTFDYQASLYLFEYVYGDSKDRGQAMVDLSNYYNQAGFIISKNELPDYLPLILEFLSLQSDVSVVREFLTDMLALIKKLGLKLKSINSFYSIFTDCLELYMGVEPEILTADLINSDLSLADIDKAWVEPKVEFTSCNSCTNFIQEVSNEL